MYQLNIKRLFTAASFGAVLSLVSATASADPVAPQVIEFNKQSKWSESRSNGIKAKANQYSGRVSSVLNSNPRTWRRKLSPLARDMQNYLGIYNSSGIGAGLKDLEKAITALKQKVYEQGGYNQVSLLNLIEQDVKNYRKSLSRGPLYNFNRAAQLVKNSQNSYTYIIRSNLNKAKYYLSRVDASDALEKIADIRSDFMLFVNANNLSEFVGFSYDSILGRSMKFNRLIKESRTKINILKSNLSPWTGPQVPTFIKSMINRGDWKRLDSYYKRLASSSSRNSNLSIFSLRNTIKDLNEKVTQEYDGLNWLELTEVKTKQYYSSWSYRRGITEIRAAVYDLKRRNRVEAQKDIVRAQAFFKHANTYLINNATPKLEEIKSAFSNFVNANGWSAVIN